MTRKRSPSRADQKRQRGPGLKAPGAGAQRAEVIVPESMDGERLDRALPGLVPELSRTLSRKIIAMGAVYLGQERCRVASRKVRTGDFLTATWHLKVTQPDHFDLVVVHEDADVIVVSKPSGQIVQGTELGDVGTLQWALTKTYGPTVRVMHRLDRPASGLLLVGRHAQSVAALAPQFREHTVERTYWAITEGLPQEGTCTLPLKRSGRRMAIAEDGDGQSARTDIRIVATDGNRTLIAATLHTGRTHQIRVHLSALGAPLVGDRAYGGPSADRLCLHAVKLGFKPRKGNETLRFSEDPPAEFWAAGAMNPPHQE